MIGPGGYPGGPRRERGEEGPDSGGEGPGRERRLLTLKEMGERSLARFIRRRRAKRRRRIFVALGLALFVAAGLGVYLGLESHSTVEEVVEEREEQGPERGGELSRERDLILQELWKMEELERAPRFPHRRR